MVNAFNLMSTDNNRKVSCYNRKLLSLEKNGLKFADRELKANRVLYAAQACSSLSLQQYFPRLQIFLCSRLFCCKHKCLLPFSTELIKKV